MYIGSFLTTIFLGACSKVQNRAAEIANILFEQFGCFSPLTRPVSRTIVDAAVQVEPSSHFGCVRAASIK